MEHFDTIVVGAGASGGVLASRLSEDPARTILLLEAGPDFPEEEAYPPSFVTGGSQFHNQIVNELDWGYWSEPLSVGRRIRLPRGRMVGGSSMTNFTQFVRGAPSDFDAWQRDGATGWGYEDVRPFYEAVEATVPIKQYRRRSWQPIQEAVWDAFIGLGYREVANMNSPDSWRGVIGPMPLNRQNEVRQGTLVTYVRRARGRANLEIRGDALVDRVTFDGTRATGVRYVDRSGQPHDVSTDLVVISAGAYNSPTILMRSGLGPAGRLKSLGVDTLVDLPVGDTLLDHAAFYFQIEAPTELVDVRSPAGACFARDPANYWWTIPASVDERDGTCMLAFCLTCSDRAGKVELVSTDPTAAPTIRHEYRLDGAEDTLETLEALLRQPSLASVRRRDAHLSVQELIAERLGTAYHPAGSCPIGPVVDEDLRVRGVENLMVVDASVFPLHVSNNPNHTCYMLGERAASFVSGGAPVTTVAAQ